MSEELTADQNNVQKSAPKSKQEVSQVSYQRGKYEEFHESAPIGYFTVDPDSTILDVNISGAKLLATTREKLLKSRLASFVSASFESEFLSFMKDILMTREWHQREVELIKTDGSKLCTLLHGRQITGPAELGIFVSNITQVKLAENALKESEEKYREVADLLAEGIYESDRNGSLSYANLKLRNSFGIDDDDIKNRIPVFEFIAAQGRKLAQERFAKIANGIDLGPQEYLMQRKDGTTFPALVHSLPILREGKLLGIRGIVFDISERLRTETALKESEQKYRELAELLGAGIFEADTNGKLTYANRKGLALFGLTENDLTNGLNVFDVIAQRDLNAASQNFARVLKQEDIGHAEYTVKRKDGTTFPALTYSSAIVRDNVVVGVRGVVVDISDLKKAEQALKESEERLRTTLDSMLEGCLIINFDWRCLYANNAVAQQGQFTKEQWIGHSIMEVIPGIENSEVYTRLKETMEKRTAQRLETELTYPNGKKSLFEISVEPVPEGILMLYLNITERKLGEERLKRTLAELDRSNKELEQFAYVTSHDLREPLRMMTSFSQLLEKRYKDKLDSTANEYIHFIVDGAARMQMLIDDILIYSRVTTRAMPFDRVEMEKILEDVQVNLKAAKEETKANITHDPLPVIQADPSQMMQVLQNLISNALKFIRTGESPNIHISAEQAGEEWIFSVKDNGIGIDPQLFGRLFNLFQRLNPPDKYPGTGVGLAVTKKIVERHGGRIWVESQSGKGSTFYFTVPLRPKKKEDGKQ